MPGVDSSRPFVPLRIAILTVSDTRTLATDTSGAILEERARAAGHEVVLRRVVPDLRDLVERQLLAWAEQGDIDVTLTTGGTGLTERDITPDAVHAVCDKLIPGFGEVFRAISMRSIGLSTLQSRATAGVCRGMPIFALPGSNGACRDAWDEVLVHQLDIRYRPCNIAELAPRLHRDPSPRPESIDLDDVLVLRGRLLRALHTVDPRGLEACLAPDATMLVPGRGLLLDAAERAAWLTSQATGVGDPVPAEPQAEPLRDVAFAPAQLAARDVVLLRLGDARSLMASASVKRHAGAPVYDLLHLAAP
ncbi:MAG: hypothetical protein H6726_20975 [Sandaracinaceae bacterium]|nr:hypothetical protein [Myxococcales bacterium]MCB9660130.1 hypothetical protein [Sandaracinaceae bacterium]